MKYFLDTEFNEDGRTIDLISIGISCEDGREFYAINQEAELHRVNDWVRANVLTKLAPYGAAAWMTRAQIRDEIMKFTLSERSPDLPHWKPEFWAYFADYDWVVLCQLFGRMIDLPKHFPMYCNDIKQLAVSLGVHRLGEVIGKPDGEHNALEDARWNKRAYEWLVSAKDKETR